MGFVIFLNGNEAQTGKCCDLLGSWKFTHELLYNVRPSECCFNVNNKSKMLLTQTTLNAERSGF